MLTKEHQVPGFRNPLWLPRALAPDENVLVQQALVELERRLVPAPQSVIRTHLGRLMNTCGTEKKLTAAEVDSKITEYARHLAEFSEPHIEATIADYVRSEKWFPFIADLRDRLLTRRTTADVMRRRARILLGLEPPSKWEIDMVARLESDRARREVETQGGTPAPELSAKIGKLTGPLAASVQRMMDGARK